ncbi:hypothetical protein CRG98_022363 [Punica granatum]|uniref:Uncharacterized protein n=1 Tax=Punica granatum TaxID=22663 RepID=A0A2I0JP22_PUNGR|nr:hypothetical protein CRG98_022363 [Punica granatum]
MQRSRFSLFLVFGATVVLLGLTSFVACMAAEIKKAKKKDLKLDGKLCYLPGSRAFMYGVIALVCLSAAQIIGNLAICKIIWSREKRSSYGKKNPIAPTVLLVLSWISYGLVILLLTGATSMSRRQGYGKGWLSGECYLVKDEDTAALFTEDVSSTTRMERANFIVVLELPT